MVGSIWNKWDLHIHTPYSHLNSKYNCSIQDVAKKIISENIKAVGVTNYFLVEENEFNELKAELKDCLVIPNFEFRINDKNKDGEFINIHVLFNPDTTTIAKIHESLGRVQLTNIAGDVTEYCTISNVKKLGAEKIIVSYTDLCAQLKKDFKIGQDYLIGGVNRGYGGFYPGGKPRDIELATKIDSASHLIFSSKEDRDFFLNKVDGRKTLGLIPKPVIVGSDAHTIDDIGKKYSWIKADLSFEGFKQILYEPEYRISLNDDKPREPIRRIESIKFNFPKNSVIKRSGSSEEQKLCIKYLKDEIYFSPYFTSIIGGRGTGKSTIINILAEKLGVRTDFFQKSNNSIYLDGKVLNIETSDKEVISIKGTEEIEFISQGQVEKLAEGDELTKLVFKERIKEIEAGLVELDKQFATFSQILDEIVKLAFELKRLNGEAKEKEKEKSLYQKIIDSINDDKYKEITKVISETNSKLALIESSKRQYEKLVESVKNVLTSTISNKDDNEYEKRAEEIIKTLKSIDELKEQGGQIIIKLNDYAATEATIKELNDKLLESNKELQKFFEAKGTSEESIRDSKNASEKVARASQEIEVVKSRIEAVRTKLKENSEKVQNIKSIYSSSEVLIGKSINEINSKLKTKNENVLEIRFAFDFNREAYRESLFEEFHKTFSEYHLANTSLEDVKKLLFKFEPDEALLALTYDDFIKQLDVLLTDNDYKRTYKYVMVITNIFSSNINFQVYKTLIRKHLYNLQRYIRIKGYYGQRELTASSFGQRCTAVIVTLLMTGVKPLVIDEPEAHLDNKLIADYLVDLIKEKKPDRQIIFATHNSNFVVNGDSELIYILEIPDSTIYTSVTATTIENLSNRDKLLKLEGGREAFLSRENKYGLLSRP